MPYSAVKTSVLFFDKASQTKDIWFYEAGLLETKKLTKKSGISDQHFADLLKVYKKRPESDRSWLIPVQKIIDSGFNISAGHYNPHGPEQEDLLEPQEYAAQIKELLKTAMQNVDELMKELKT